MRGDKTLLTPHALYQELSQYDETRLRRYRMLCEEQLSDTDLDAIRLATHYCQPLDDDKFRLQIEGMLGRKVGQSRRGRAKKSTDQK